LDSGAECALVSKQSLVLSAQGRDLILAVMLRLLRG
jgi:hypothetical protein